MRTDYSYIGSGRILTRARGASSGLIELGNCSALTFGVEQEKKSLRDFRSPGGGAYNSLDRITSVNMSITATDLSPQNLSMALYGNTSAVVGGSITNEPQVAYAGGYLTTDYDATAITAVKNKITPATVYTAGTDYIFQYGAIFIPAGSTIPVPSDPDTPNITIDYTSKSGNLVQALTSAAQELEMVFLGLNEADSGSSATVKVWRAKFGPAASIALIGDDYASLEMSGSLLADASKTGLVSQYFQTFLEG
jgi:hypothetical protein